jgi:hypothetical protein
MTNVAGAFYLQCGQVCNRTGIFYDARDGESE